MGFRVNADQIKTNYTDTLSRFTADLKYEDIPAEVREPGQIHRNADGGRGAGHEGHPHR